MDPNPLRASLQRHMVLRSQAQSLLGERSWFLLQHYGKLMRGSASGSYVSALSAEAQLELVERLAAGQIVDVHLMHRHRSGTYEPSSLRWREGRLVMVFKDRERPA